MQPVPQTILDAFQAKFPDGDHRLIPHHLGEEGSDGAIYRFRDRDVLLKICLLSGEESRRELLKFEKRLAFLTFLFKQGVPVVEPLPSADGGLFEVLEDARGVWAAYAMKKIQGKTMSPKVWVPDFVQRWGAAVGRLHKVTQAYPDWERTLDPLTGEDLISWQAEVESFIHLADEPEIREQWHAIREALTKLPVQRDGFGLIHNDPHLWNVRWDGTRAVLLDFEVANHHWFAADIATACQHVLSMISGGMTHPLGHPEWLGDFLREFLKGYRQENDLPQVWLERMELFFAYRRLLLYTVMPGWREADPALGKSWKKMILERPSLMDGIHL